MTPPAFSMPAMTEPPASPSWHQDVPGVGTNLEDLRWFVVREFGQLHATAREQAQRAYDARLDIEALKVKLDGKANVQAVQNKFAEDNALFEAQIASMNETMSRFGEQVTHAFASVEAIDASFKQHVAGNFSETVAAIQWLDGNVDTRFLNAKTAAEGHVDRLERKIVELEATFGSASRAPARAEGDLSRGSSGAAAGDRLSGCAAGPFACGQC